jgi:hypothetical protein
MILELAIPDALEASGRWSLDHLFVDRRARYHLKVTDFGWG